MSNEIEFRKGEKALSGLQEIAAGRVESDYGEDFIRLTCEAYKHLEECSPGSGKAVAALLLRINQEREQRRQLIARRLKRTAKAENALRSKEFADAIGFIPNDSHE